MSFKVFAHVLNLKIGNPTAKLILAGLAEHAHDDGTAAFPGPAKLATYAECSERSVKRHLKYLRQHGFIKPGDQRFVAHLRADRRPVVYDLAVNEAARQRWASALTATSERYDEIMSPRQRGDNLTPRGETAGETGGQIDTPQARGDRKTVYGVTELCHPNPPIEPSSSPQPPSSATDEAPAAAGARPEEAEEAGSEYRAAAAALVAALPGNLTPGQCHRLAETVTGFLAAGWTGEALTAELAVNLDGVRSFDAVYRHRLASLPTEPPVKAPAPQPDLPPIGGEVHTFDPDPADADSCRRCPRPKTNRIHTSDTNQISRTKPVRPAPGPGPDGFEGAQARSGRRAAGPVPAGEAVATALTAAGVGHGAA